MSKSWAFGLSGATLLLASSAWAHVSVSGSATAGTNQVLTFGVGHGCEGFDTVRVSIAIPEEVMSLRPFVGPDGFGEPVIAKNDADAITSVTWEKNASREGDDLYYSFAMRVAIPETPFATLYFPATQTCLDAEGEEVVVAWDAMTTGHEEDVNPAPSIVVMPERHPGWNKFEIEDAISDLSVFDDAQIVWSGDAAYSSNPTTVAMIEDEDDVEPLTEIEAGAEIWVKY